MHSNANQTHHAPDALAHAQRIQSDFAPQLIAWQRQHGRHNLPWQQNKTPYRVWVSEIMLQQTQVATVIGYYQRFLNRFPDVHSLANASESDVLNLWAGLGYYTRARNLWRCAQTVAQEHGGVFPNTAQSLTTLPGIGPSTAAAIASICFGRRISILDANVQRVLSRIFHVCSPIDTAATKRQLATLAEILLPSTSQCSATADTMPTYTQALMDLGAGTCTSKRPNCTHCPIRAHCLAEQHGTPANLPIKKRKTQKQHATWHFLWLENTDDQRTLLEQRTPTNAASSPTPHQIPPPTPPIWHGNIWKGLWSFIQHDGALDQWLAEHDAPSCTQHRITHILSHKKLDLHITHLTANQTWLAKHEQSLLSRLNSPTARWLTPQELTNAGLPAPFQKLLSTPSRKRKTTKKQQTTPKNKK